jgi:glycosyltransferase involved in cell wall biosynthesis
MFMHKVVWITGHHYIDTDLPVIKHLNNDCEFQIEWFIFYIKNRTSFKDIKNSFKSNKVIIHDNFIKKRLSSIFTFFYLIRTFFKIKKLKADVYYVNCDLEPYFSILFRIIIGKKKIIYAIHDVIPHYGTKKVNQIFLKIKFIFFENFQVYSNTQRNLFRYKQKNLFLIPQYLKNYGEIKNEINNDKIIFLFFGKIRKNKGLNILIEAVNLFQLEYKKKIKIIIAGKSDNWQEYEKTINDLTIYDININFIPDQFIPYYFTIANYLILPYRDVTQSGPLLIGINYNLPSITSDLDGFKEIINDNENGLLFKSNDSYSLYEKMKQTIDEHPVLYEKLKINLNMYKKINYSIENISLKYIQIFCKIMNQS